MKEYECKKVTGDNFDFPGYCYYFINKLLEYSKCIVRPDDKLDITLITPYHPFCYEGLEVVAKTLERKGFSTRIPTFHRMKKGGKDMFHYGFTLKKHVNCDDLPF